MKKLFALIALGLLCYQSSVISTNQIDGLNNVVYYGQQNKISGTDNQVIGHENNISGQGNAALGLKNQLKGNGNIVAGVGNTISGKGNLVDGHGNIVLGSDASEEDKALLNQKMMDMFASRGLGGIPGLSVASNQASDNARDSSAEFSTSNNNKNNNLQPQALQQKSDPQPQQLAPPKTDNSKKLLTIENQQINPEPVVQKKEQKVKLQNSSKNPSNASQAYVIQSKETRYDYNLADKKQTMPDDDLTFFDSSKTKAKEITSTSSSITQKQKQTKVDPKPVNTVVVQTVSQTQLEPKKVVTSLPVQPVQPKAEVIVKPQTKPEQKPVEPVKTEAKIVQVPRTTPVVPQKTLPVAAQQNQIQAQQNKVSSSSKVNPPKEESEFKFYVNNESNADSSLSTSTQIPSYSRYSRVTKTIDQVPEIVTVPPIKFSNLRQEETPKVVESVDNHGANNSDNIKVIQSSSSVLKQSQASKQSASSSPSSSVNVLSSSSTSQKGSTQTVLTPSSTDNLSGSSPSSSSINAAETNRYKRDSSQVSTSSPVVVSTTSSVIVSSSVPSISSTKPVRKTANDVAASYLSPGNQDVIILSGDQTLSGSSGAVVNKQPSQVRKDFFINY